MFPGEAFVWQQDSWVLWYTPHCQGRGHSSLFTSSACTTLEGEKVPAPSYRFVGTTPNRTLFGPTLPSPRYPAQLVSVLMREVRTVQSWNILGVRNLEAVVWDQDDVLSSLL